jgi:uncharacterized protein (DUF1330 family)
MAAYVIARIAVSDWGKYQAYVKATPAVIAKYGGKFLCRAGEMVTLEGPEETRRIVLIEFPSLDRAKEFYHSADYQAVRKLRLEAATGQLIAVEGVEQGPGGS